MEDSKLRLEVFVNSNWDDEEEVIILSETVADDGVIGMLSGMLVKPTDW